MIPVALTTLAPLATTALETWNRMAEARDIARLHDVKAAANQDFRVMLAKANAVTGAQGVQSTQYLSGLQQQFQSQLRELPEVRGLLAASQPGTTLHLTVSSGSQLSVDHPNGARQSIILSASSQQLVRQMSEVASLSHPGNISGIIRFTLTA